ncbi:histidine kinase dimerization/phospho-acceptor domain-containing protein [Peribacillus simplex]|uniref:histidine kinase dimerization/phospho-acceptor domain-containing protein n=1 Tax=Peribacillus simplex TaxID=1478 RepID=UPI000BA6AF77|nr:histidine kinase dimerization/phospho-acceptor domain-containing protein [Peribacillus simplex]PAL08274.1 hypothetical protein B8W99_22340 [Peribacillus simplex]
MIHQWVHQMKTPVSVISLLIQEGKRTFSNEPMKDYLKEMEEENDRFRRGLEIILHGARLQRFSEDVKSERVDLINVVKQVINEEKNSSSNGSYIPGLKRSLRMYMYIRIVSGCTSPLVRWSLMH